MRLEPLPRPAGAEAPAAPKGGEGAGGYPTIDILVVCYRWAASPQCPPRPPLPLASRRWLPPLRSVRPAPPPQQTRPHPAQCAHSRSSPPAQRAACGDRADRDRCAQPGLPRGPQRVRVRRRVQAAGSRHGGGPQQGDAVGSGLGAWGLGAARAGARRSPLVVRALQSTLSR